MRYNIFDGGNALQLPYNVITSGRVGDYRVAYAEHHKRRTLEIEKHIDTQSYAWNGFDFSLHGESDDKPITLADNDEMATHIFGAGTLFDYVVFHVKRPGSGTIRPFIEQDDGVKISVVGVSGEALAIDLSVPGHYYGLVPAQVEAAEPKVVVQKARKNKRDADDEEAPTAGATVVKVTVPGQTVEGVAVVVPSQTIAIAAASVTDDKGVVVGTIPAHNVVTAEQTVLVDVTTADEELEIAVPRGPAAEGAGAGASVPYMTSDNGVLGFTFTAALDDDEEEMAFDACMGIYMAIKDFWDEHECECAPAPCVTEYPDATCAPNKAVKK